MPTLGRGGAERIVTYLANSLVNSTDYSIFVLILRSEGNDYVDSLSSKIHIIIKDFKGSLQKNILRVVKEILKLKPDICFTSLDALNLLLAPFIGLFRLRKISMLVRETNVLSYRWNKWRSLWILRIYYRLFYTQYTTIINQSDDMMKDLRIFWGIKSNKLIKINNPVDCKVIQDKAIVKNPIPENIQYFVAVGRLHPQKGYEQLINNIYKLKEDGLFNYKLYILGDGILREEIYDQIKRLNLSKTIILLGYVKNPYPIIKDAKGIILGSKYEGFPNVLIEANALGIPILANNCPGGINEIVIRGENGYIVNFDNYSEFKKTFILFDSTNFVKQQIINLTQSRYDLSVIIPKYLGLFHKIIDRKYIK